MNGDKIKELRKRMGLTQTEFAKEMRVSFATVNRWEKGHFQPLPDRLERLQEMIKKERDR